MPKYSEEIAALNQELIADEEKFSRGNASAGIRMRKTLQKIKKVCQEGRKFVQDSKNTDSEEEAA